METISETFAVLGGDRRLYWTARGLREMGCTVRTFALDDPDGAFASQSLPQALAGADVVLLPLPAFTGENLLNVSAGQPSVALSALLDRLSPGMLVFGGKLEAQATAFAEAGVTAVDYLASETLAVANAIPAAAAIWHCKDV